jgi:hypothetical protein
MWVRNVTLTMSFFCLMLTSIFALSGVLYDAQTYTGYAVGLFLFGTMYSVGVLLMSLFHDIMEHPRRFLWASFILATIPTVFYFFVLYVLAFL